MNPRMARQNAGMADDDRSGLAEFLRSRRERLKPTDVGLPGTGRRRTPGLRREELATLAGISVDYLVRLEQGRETNPSPDVLSALADALRLTQDEAHHMGLIATKNRLAPRLCPKKTASEELDETTLMLLERMAPTPAFVLEPTATVAAWNDPYERLMRATGLFDLEPPNLLRYTFLVPGSRSVFKDWDAVAREQVGNLRSVAVFCTGGGSPVSELVGELSINSPEFAQLWADHDIDRKTWGTKQIVHPTAGPLALRYEALLLPDESHRQLVAYLPADEATAEALDDLVTPAPEAPTLRVIASR
jgi:transcriptional regulator with XRE-family HTH domain